MEELVKLRRTQARYLPLLHTKALAPSLCVFAGILQSGVAAGFHSSMQKLSPLTPRNTVQRYTKKIDPLCINTQWEL